MKLKTLLFGALVGVAFVACTNDNEPAGVTPAKGADEVAAAPKYMTVNFVTSDGAATRATAEEENAIESAAFIFFNADGSKQVAKPFIIAKNDNDAVTVTGYEGYSKKWTDTTKAVVVLENPTEIPASLVVLVNADLKVVLDLAQDADATAIQNALYGKKLSDLKKIAKDFSAEGEGKFVMSNAVYNDANGNNVIGTPVGADNVKDTPAAAELSPVKVNVDRVLAKVTVSKKEGLKPESGVEGIEVEIQGWGLVYENTQSYLIKNLADSYTTLPASFVWNDVTNKRSYWATAADYSPKKDEQGNLVGPTFSTLSDIGASLYTQENTEFQTFKEKFAKDETIENPTAVVVAAKLKKGNAYPNLYKFAGILYEGEALQTLLAKSAAAKKYFKQTKAPTETTPAVYDNFAPDEFTMTEDATAGESYQANVYLVLPTDKDVYTIEGTTAKKLTAEEIKTANSDLKDAGETVEFWAGGQTYYYVPIERVAKNGEETPALLGIVRNHEYKLTINSIKGLGTAVPDPDQVIIPVTPEKKDYFIAAQIEVLPWKLVEQQVNLGAE